MGFPRSSDVKESACNAGDLGSISGLGRSPGGGHDNPLQYSCLENPQGQRSLVGSSAWRHMRLKPLSTQAPQEEELKQTFFTEVSRLTSLRSKATDEIPVIQQTLAV